MYEKHVQKWTSFNWSSRATPTEYEHQWVTQVQYE